MDGRTEGRTDRQTNNPEAICPSNFFEVGGIMMPNVGLPLQVLTILKLFTILNCFSVQTQNAGGGNFLHKIFKYVNTDDRI